MQNEDIILTSLVNYFEDTWDGRRSRKRPAAVFPVSHCGIASSVFLKISRVPTIPQKDGIMVMY